MSAAGAVRYQFILLLSLEPACKALEVEGVLTRHDDLSCGTGNWLVADAAFN